MTQQQVADIKEALDNVYKCVGRNCDDLYSLQAKRAYSELLTAKCDHTNPDGTSAIQGSIFCSSCDICRWNDL